MGEIRYFPEHELLEYVAAKYEEHPFIQVF